MNEENSNSSDSPSPFNAAPDASATGNTPAETPAPKRRGRRPKNAEATSDSAENPPAPKRRGRAKKSVPAETDVPASSETQNATPAEDAPSVPASDETKKSVFSFDPADEIPAPEPSFPEPAPAPSFPATEPEPNEPAPAPSVPANETQAAPQGNDNAENSQNSFQRPWERNKDRSWKQKSWNNRRDGADKDSAGTPNQGEDSSSSQRPWDRRNDQQRHAFRQKPSKFNGGKFNAQGKFEKFNGDKNFAPRRNWGELANTDSAEDSSLSLGSAFDYNLLENEAYLDELSQLARHIAKRPEPANTEDSSPTETATPTAENATENAPATPTLLPDTPEAVIDFNEIYESSMSALIATAKSFDIPVFRNPVRRPLVKKILRQAFAERRPIHIAGTLEMLADGNGLLLYGCDSYRVRELSAFVPAALIKKFGLQRGHDLEAIAFPPMKGETAPIVVHIESIMGVDPETVKDTTPFTELTPYYPTERIVLESTDPAAANNLSMRCVDLLCPIGLGQRGLIVAPPRTGKTVLLQTIANSIAQNKPNAHLIILLVDERPEEVTDFKRKTTRGEVISSTFDETPENHVHVAEMVIERARRMVELGKDVVILLDSITRLARAYNTLMPNGGKILSGGVEAGALSKPKRFFGSARNIENGGSLTILGTALIDTGSKMDEVIFEEFKGTGNMELDLDRDLANKRIYPAINFERSGTRKEELLYHPQEMQCVYSMRRAMKGVPSIEAMEMLISRMKKTKTNAEFLITLAGR